MPRSTDAEPLGRLAPNPQTLPAQVDLAALRAAMFGRDADVCLGRYRLKRALGRGAYGVVFEALDEKLRRPVAVKVLEVPAPADPTRKARHDLLREARVMAGVDHPNVVTVYDAGIEDDQLWIAMELVRGGTLEGWAADHPPGSKARFARAGALLAQAGEGLAAAHAAGVVHRDFKPANLLVGKLIGKSVGKHGEAERAQVVDFGLARVRRHATLEWPAGVTGRPDAASRAGGGTPRYMSPEQLRPGHVDHRSDQFNFAVTAWELVYGRLPHEAPSIDELVARIEAGPPSLPRTTAVPRWYGRALRRALSPRPADRYPSLRAMLDAMDPTRRRRRVWMGAVGLGAASAAVATAWWPVGGTRDNASRCGPATAKAIVAAVWNEERRGSVRNTVSRGDSWASQRGDALVAALDDHVRAWQASYIQSCRARWVAAAISDRQLDTRMACLRRSLDTAVALAGRFEAGPNEVSVNAVAAVARLPDPEACRSVGPALGDDPPGVRPLRRELAAADASRIAGRYWEAAEAAAAIAEQARMRSAQALRGDALELAGRAWSELDDPRRFDVLARAHALAETLGADRRAARIAIALARQHGYAWHLDDARVWLRHAAASLERRPDPELALARRHAHGLWLLKRHQVDEALAALESLQHDLGDTRSTESETAWLLRADLMLVYAAVGEVDRAMRLAEALYAETVDAFGPEHPRLVRLSSELSRMEARRGRNAQAIAHAQRAVDVSVAAYGSRARLTAIAYAQLGRWHHNEGELTAAADNYAAALAACGDDDTEWRARALRGLGRVAIERGETQSGAALLRRAVSEGKSVWPPGRAELLGTRLSLARAWIELGKLAEAEATLLQIVELAAGSGARSEAVEAGLELVTVSERAHRLPEAVERLQQTQAACRAAPSGIDACAGVEARLAARME